MPLSCVPDGAASSGQGVEDRCLYGLFVRKLRTTASSAQSYFFPRAARSARHGLVRLVMLTAQGGMVAQGLRRKMEASPTTKTCRVGQQEWCVVSSWSRYARLTTTSVKGSVYNSEAASVWNTALFPQYVVTF